MMERNPTLARALFSLMLLGALGFGASQAVASPGTAPSALACTQAEKFECIHWCNKSGQQGQCIDGICHCR